MIIRPVRDRDLSQWAAMRYALWPEDSVEQHLVAAQQILTKKEYVGFVAEENGRLIGFVEVAIRPYADGCDAAPISFVEGIWVDAAHRRQGLGQKFIATAEAWSREQGIFELGSDTLLANKLGQDAHRAWGFEERERVVYFRKRL